MAQGEIVIINHLVKNWNKDYLLGYCKKIITVKLGQVSLSAWDEMRWDYCYCNSLLFLLLTVRLYWPEMVQAISVCVPPVLLLFPARWDDRSSGPVCKGEQRPAKRSNQPIFASQPRVLKNHGFILIQETETLMLATLLAFTVTGSPCVWIPCSLPLLDLG